MKNTVLNATKMSSRRSIEGKGQLLRTFIITFQAMQVNILGRATRLAATENTRPQARVLHYLCLLLFPRVAIQAFLSHHEAIQALNECDFDDETNLRRGSWTLKKVQDGQCENPGLSAFLIQSLQSFDVKEPLPRPMDGLNKGSSMMFETSAVEKPSLFFPEMLQQVGWDNCTVRTWTQHGWKAKKSEKKTCIPRQRRKKRASMKTSTPSL